MKSKPIRPRAEPSLLPLPENEYAIAALSRLRDPEPPVLPPIVYLHGPPGVGKSMLLRSFKNELLAHNDRTKIDHVSAATFVEMTLEAIDRNLLDDLYTDFRVCDYFFCEDLAAVRSHKHVQRVLATVLDDVVAHAGRVVLTAAAPPGDVGGLVPRLLNRCRSATLAELAFPGVESRQKLITHFAAHRQLAITDEAVRVLAAELPASPRELAATVGRLELLLKGRKENVVRVPLIERLLAGEVAAPKIPLSTIARTVARHYGVTMAKLRDPSRRRSHVAARQCAMFLARRLSGKTYAQIAGYFGRKNHSTVVHACRRFRASLVSDVVLNDDLHHICIQLGVGHHTLVENLSTD